MNLFNLPRPQETTWSPLFRVVNLVMLPVIALISVRTATQESGDFRTVHFREPHAMRYLLNASNLVAARWPASEFVVKTTAGNAFYRVWKVGSP